MTTHEAIEYMKGYRLRLVQALSNGLDKDIEAFDIAIKALEDSVTVDEITELKPS
ncbi:MAG: hypothetical protein IKE92_05300 [Clostridiales bacterium]|nr:hypothetical protein [Clostridiales bacterium]